MRLSRDASAAASFAPRDVSIIGVSVSMENQGRYRESKREGSILEQLSSMLRIVAPDSLRRGGFCQIERLMG